jgi:hypothetical protein
MSQPSGKEIYIPPYSGVRLIECPDHFQLVPVPAVRVMYGYGKIKSREARVDPDNPQSEPVWDDIPPDTEVWAVMQWDRYEDGHEVQGNVCFMRPECTEERVLNQMDQMAQSSSVMRKEALGMLQCYHAPQEDHDFVEENFPNYQSEPDPSATDDYDVYHARLEVMSELQPKTVALIKIANCTKDPEKRKIAEREAVQSYFAELAHYFTEDEILAWQRTNPVGTGWMCEFGEVMREPRRTLDPVNHELALNWLRQKYNEMTAKELSVSIFKRIFLWFTPDAIKKRREKLGLTTKRPPGPRPKSDCQ